jgi:hemerythrin-like domain-containing protein
VVKALDGFYKGDEKAIGEITSGLADLVEFYPKHIEKEDKHFFIPVMDYFTTAERDEMLEEFREYDRIFIHEKYRALITELENR